MKKLAIHGAASSTGTDQIFAAVPIIDDKRTVLLFDFSDFVLVHACTAALQQKIVKLDSTDRMLGSLFRKVEMLEVEVQPVEAHETMWIVIDIEFEIVDDFRCNPSGAQFRSWKTRKIKYENIDAGLA